MKHKIRYKLKHVAAKEDSNNSYKKIVIVFIAVLIIVLIGTLIFMQKKLNTKSEETNVVEHIEEDKSNDSPQENDEDISKRQEEEKANSDVVEMSTQIHELLKENEKYYGIYYCDLNTGVQFSINGDEEFHAASTIKVPIAMMIADKLYNKEISEETLIEYTPLDAADGAGVLQGEISDGDKVCVSDLMKYMIEESDNIATSMLKRNVGSISDYIFNITSINARNEDNYITPKQSSIILEKLYEESKENMYYRKVIQMMKETSSHDRIDKYIPNNLVAHKIGDYEKYVNDVGIVYTNNPYILAVYTKDVMEQGRENIAQVSKIIYDIKSDN